MLRAVAGGVDNYILRTEPHKLQSETGLTLRKLLTRTQRQKEEAAAAAPPASAAARDAAAAAERAEGTAADALPLR